MTLQLFGPNVALAVHLQRLLRRLCSVLAEAQVIGTRRFCLLSQVFPYDRDELRLRVVL